MSLDRRSAAEALAIVLERRRAEEKQLIPRRVTGRNDDGTVNYQRFDGECVERGPMCAVYDGMIVERPCRPPLNLQGTSGLPMLSTRRASDTLHVESLDPAILPQGFAGTVTVTGRGIKPTFRLQYLLLDEETVNEAIEVTGVTVVDGNTAELAVTVSAEHEIPLELWPVAFDNVGYPL